MFEMLVDSETYVYYYGLAGQTYFKLGDTVFEIQHGMNAHGSFLTKVIATKNSQLSVQGDFSSKPLANVKVVEVTNNKFSGYELITAAGEVELRFGTHHVLGKGTSLFDVNENPSDSYSRTKTWPSYPDNACGECPNMTSKKEALEYIEMLKTFVSNTMHEDVNIKNEIERLTRLLKMSYQTIEKLQNDTAEDLEYLRTKNKTVIAKNIEQTNMIDAYKKDNEMLKLTVNEMRKSNKERLNISLESIQEIKTLKDENIMLFNENVNLSNRLKDVKSKALNQVFNLRDLINNF